MSNLPTDDLDHVNADLLPPQARQLVRHIGLANTLKLLERRGGTTLQVPYISEDSAVLAGVLPPDAVIAVCRAFPGQRLELPKCDKILKQIRDHAIKNERKQATAPSLAIKYGLTRLQIINICHNIDDNDLQDDLFGL